VRQFVDARRTATIQAEETGQSVTRGATQTRTSPTPPGHGQGHWAQQPEHERRVGHHAAKPNHQASHRPRPMGRPQSHEGEHDRDEGQRRSSQKGDDLDPSMTRAARNRDARDTTQKAKDPGRERHAPHDSAMPFEGGVLTGTTHAGDSRMNSRGRQSTVHAGGRHRLTGRQRQASIPEHRPLGLPESGPASVRSGWQAHIPWH
jgi:hypothetical protein